ncbi:MAG: stage IV sporulation protein A [Oscillospiraceae bacterium]|nr:stage IV sporulation protein A [Oscillospiraceae bacterium]MBQ5325133.1 stage IV sporulation protein A [Oscillospiraceae bacterium]
MNIYDDIRQRTQGSVFIGVVGAVRTGKSTFIKKFMEALVIPNIQDADKKVRTIDELPQSAAGRTIMTTQPNFIPEQGVDITINENHNLRVRLVDCVGYMVKGAQGDTEDGKPRMVKTPWFKQAIPFEKAAEIGTYKVISEHSTIGIMVTCDGTISDIPRENYVTAEETVVAQLKKIGKPFVIVLNSAQPQSAQAQKLRQQLQNKYGVSTVLVNCLEMTKQTIEEILSLALAEFPVKEIRLMLPKWVAMQNRECQFRKQLMEDIRQSFTNIGKISQVEKAVEGLSQSENVISVHTANVDFGTGSADVKAEVDKNIYYDTLEALTGENVRDDWSLMKLITELCTAKREYQKLAPALSEVERTGYGIVMPSIEQLHLEEPEIVRQGQKFGVRLKASAPSLHILKADIHTEVSPIVGSEANSEELVNSMLKNFESDPLDIWQSNIFGNSLQNLVTQGLNTKLLNVPQEARGKLQETIQQVINEGCQGLICVIL